MRPQNQIAVILMPIRVTLTGALICTLWRATCRIGGFSMTISSRHAARAAAKRRNLVQG